jgi:hypothetical protein
MVTITTATTEVETKPFPKLMKGKRTGGIFFFTEPNKGLLIKEGRWYETWDMDDFEDYNEPITLKNK